MLKLFTVHFAALAVFAGALGTACRAQSIALLNEQEIAERCAAVHETAAAISACLLDWDRRYGAELETSYGRALADTGLGGEPVRVAQRAWLKYQEAQCALEGRSARADGPSFEQLAKSKCLVRTTINRIHELRSLAAAR